MKMKIIFIMLAFCSIITAQSKELTLDECINLGLTHSKLLKISESEVIRAEAASKEVGTQMLPNLSLSGSYSYINIQQPEQLPLPMPVPLTFEKPINMYGMGVTLTQPIFTGFRLSSMNSASKSIHMAVKTFHEKRINDHVLELQNGFWNLYKAQKNVDLLEETRVSLENHQNNVKELVRNEMAIENDSLKLVVQIAKIDQLMADAEIILNTAEGQYNLMIGFSINENIKLKHDYTFAFQPVGEYNDLVDQAIQNRSDIKSVNHKINASNESITAQNAAWWPQLYASGSFYYYNLNAPSMKIDNQNIQAWNLGLGLSWDLWNWGATSAKADQAKQQAFENQTTLEMLKEQIEIEVFRNYQEFVSFGLKIRSTELEVKAAEEDLRIISEKYKEGSSTITELIDSEVAVMEASIKYEFALIDKVLAYMKLNHSVGRKLY